MIEIVVRGITIRVFHFRSTDNQPRIPMCIWSDVKGSNIGSDIAIAEPVLETIPAEHVETLKDVQWMALCTGLVGAHTEIATCVEITFLRLGI